jgi:hypothetical protein
MKKFKRNAVILAVLLFVCVAVYLNWAYNKTAPRPRLSASGTQGGPAGDGGGCRALLHTRIRAMTRRISPRRV